MSHMKTVEVKKNWLDEIDGKTVAEAIKYLSTLNQDHRLDCYMEGDTHGCSIHSRLLYTVPMSNKEIYADIERHCLKEIATYEKAKLKHQTENRQDRVDSCERMIAQFKAKLEAAKIQYLKK